MQYFIQTESEQELHIATADLLLCCCDILRQKI